MTEPDPRARPEETLDALEEKVFGERRDQRRDDSEDVPAYEQDLDNDQGVDAHTDREPPV